MQVLTVEENIRLQNILIRHSLLADAESRHALLINCGLKSITNKIPMEGSTVKFVNLLCAQLIDAHSGNDPLEEPALVTFLDFVYLVQHDDDITSEEADFLAKLSDMCRERHRTSNQNPRKRSINALLLQERQRRSPLSLETSHVPRKIDRDIILSYDLEKQMALFRQKLRYGGVFPFTVGGHNIILRDYIIERMCRELTSKMRREHIKIDISLHLNDEIENLNIIEKKIVNRLQYKSLYELFEINPMADIVLVIWNYTFPMERLRVVARFFLETVNQQVLPLLREQVRCFVIILANADAKGKMRTIDDFTILPTPTKFEITDLVAWVNGYLRARGVNQTDIEYCLNRLRDQHGHFIGTYQEMEFILDLLQGREKSQ